MESALRDLKQTLAKTILNTQNWQLKAQSYHMKFGADFSQNKKNYHILSTFMVRCPVLCIWKHMLKIVSKIFRTQKLVLWPEVLLKESLRLKMISIRCPKSQNQVFPPGFSPSLFPAKCLLFILSNNKVKAI